MQKLQNNLIDYFYVMYGNNEWNELDEVDEVESTGIVPDWSTSFSKREVLHSFIRVK